VSPNRDVVKVSAADKAGRGWRHKKPTPADAETGRLFLSGDIYWRTGQRAHFCRDFSRFTQTTIGKLSRLPKFFRKGATTA